MRVDGCGHACIIAASARIPRRSTGAAEPQPQRATPGRKAVRITLARSLRHAGYERVALVTLVTGPRSSGPWRRVGGIGVDGGTAAFAAAEAGARLERRPIDAAG